METCFPVAIPDPDQQPAVQPHKKQLYSLALAVNVVQEAHDGVPTWKVHIYNIHFSG